MAAISWKSGISGSTIALATTSALTGSLTVVAGTSGDTLIEFGGASGAGGQHFGPIAPATGEQGMMVVEMRPEGIGEHFGVVLKH